MSSPPDDATDDATDAADAALTAGDRPRPRRPLSLGAGRVIAHDGRVLLVRSRRPLSLGAGAVIVHDGRVLLVRNIRGVTRGRYLLPAGGLHPAGRPPPARRGG